MIAALLGFVGQYRIFIYLGLAALFLSGVWLHGRSAGVKSLEDDVVRAESMAANWQHAANNYKTLIDAQNKAVEALKQSQAIRVKNLKDMAAAANVESRKYKTLAEKRAAEIHAMKLPENECEAIKLLVDAARTERVR